MFLKLLSKVTYSVGTSSFQYSCVHIKKHDDKYTNILNLCFITDFLQKGLWKNPQWTGQPHLAKGFINGRNFHNIRRKLDKNVLIRIIPTKGCEQNNNNKLESLNSPGKGLHQQEKLSQFQKKIAYKKNYGLC